MGIANGDSLPVAICTNSAQPHEIKLVEKTIAHRFTKQKPKRLIGDRAYDSDPLDEALRKQKIELIAPHKNNRKKKKTQDGRTLRKYRNRWKVERLFAWIQNFRRCLTRYEYYEENFLGFLRWACIILLINHF
jgi:transposase